MRERLIIQGVVQPGGTDGAVTSAPWHERAMSSKVSPTDTSIASSSDRHASWKLQQRCGLENGRLYE